ncbi:acyltransferase family protein [Pedococcus bigeumensis]|uniref:Acyltransferase n=1 Tax=Pedococcus bigeumensis TaxID=433644 RepID=A0A502CU44_9MICO|nr:acyltransferase [Pedococcus bigeumensis]TPG16050.1 acyltransferase [Pedococcus bigeumensis]
MSPAAERLDLRHNSLNAIRLLLATLVMVSHAFPISGLAPEPHLGDIKLGTLAVGGFFTISGYLISHSRLNSSLISYAWRRFLRIFPGYWVALAFTAFVAAWLGGTVRGGWSVSNATTFVLSSADMVGGSSIDDRTLAGAPLTGSWNGSLWTLKWEVLCYIAVGLALGLAILWRRSWVSVAAFVGATAVTLGVHLVGPAAGPIYQATLLVPYFVAGMMLLRLSDRVHLTGKGAVVAAVALLLACLLHVGEPLGPLPLAYLLLYAGAAAPKVFQRVGAPHDFSYGMYLYAFPVQQLLILAGLRDLGLVGFIVASILATTPFAVASWFAVERPAMMAKHLPARWRRGATSAPEAPDARPAPVGAREG